MVVSVLCDESMNKCMTLPDQAIIYTYGRLIISKDPRFAIWMHPKDNKGHGDVDPVGEEHNASLI